MKIVTNNNNLCRDDDANRAKEKVVLTNYNYNCKKLFKGLK